MPGQDAGPDAAVRLAAARRLAAQGHTPGLDALAALAGRLLSAPLAAVALLSDEVVVLGRHWPDRGQTWPAAVVDAACRGTVARGRAAATVVEPGAYPGVDPGAEAGAEAASGSSDADATALGVPLTAAEGAVVGALVVVDRRPRAWSEADVGALREVARTVVAAMDLADREPDADSVPARGLVAADIGTFDWDLDTDEVVWDARLRELMGYTGAGARTAGEFRQRVHPDDVVRVHEATLRAVAERGHYSAEFRVVPPDGRTRWVEARGRVMTDGTGRPTRMVGAAYDTTDVRRARDHVARVLETMSTAYLAVDRAWAITYVNAEAERLLRLRQSDLGRNVWEIFPEALGGPFEQHYSEALRTGRPVTFEQYLPGLGRWFEIRAWPGPEGLSVYLADIQARHLAEEAARESAERLGILSAAGVRLSETLDADRLFETLADVTLPRLGTWLSVALRAEVAAALAGDAEPDDPREVRVVFVAHMDPQKMPRVRSVVAAVRMTTRDALGPGRVTRTGRTEWAPEVPDEMLLELATEAVPIEALRTTGRTAMVSVPIVSRGRTLGAMTVSAPEGGELDRQLLEDLAMRAGLALDNAALYRTERALALTLQRFLLPAEPPGVPGIEVAVRYLPGTTGTEVGGDFHIVRRLHDGRVVLVIGDVMGKGVQAAARMGQLRSVVATLAAAGDPPGRVLERLVDEVAEITGLELATVLVGVYDPSSAVVDLASAGHPPPLVASGGRAPAYLPVDPGPPVGIGPASYPTLRATLERPATLVLYTDGLVEGHDRPIGDGMDLLAAALADAPDGAEATCDHLLRRLGREQDNDDDVALLVLRAPAPDGREPDGRGPDGSAAGAGSHGPAAGAAAEGNQEVG